MLKIHFLRFSRYLIFLIVFNALFFVLGGTERNTSVWISYGFIHFACFMLWITSQLVRTGKSEAIFKWTLTYISFVYFLVELLIGTVFILLALEGYKAAFLVQLTIAGIYGLALVYYLLANEWTADAEKQRQVRISFIKDASARLKGLWENISDKEAKKKVERVYDAIYSSPVKSHPDLAQMEDHILQSIRALGEAVASGNKDNIITLAGSLESAIDERNRQLKTYP